MLNNSIKTDRPYAPPKGLFRTIIKRIGLEKTLVALKNKLTFTEFALSVAVILFIAILVLLREEIAESGFFIYLSLFFSDPKMAMKHWTDLSLSVLEAVPAIFISLLFVFLGVILLTVKLVAGYFEKFSQVNNKINKSLKYHGHK